MKKLMVDMDDCIVTEHLMPVINEFLGTNYDIEEQDDFYLQNLTGEKKRRILQIFND